MSSQWANSSAIARADCGSLAAKFSTVWSEKTTPQPKVTPGALRSNTSTSCAASRSFIEIAKYSPAGPPPMHAIFIARAPWHCQGASGNARNGKGRSRMSRKRPPIWRLMCCRLVVVVAATAAAAVVIVGRRRVPTVVARVAVAVAVAAAPVAVIAVALSAAVVAVPAPACCRRVLRSGSRGEAPRCGGRYLRARAGSGRGGRPC